MEALAARQKYHSIEFYYLPVGPRSKDKYPKHIEFMKAGKQHLMRAFYAANGCGKTTCGGCEFTYHLTGDYPKDWEGRVFNHPVKAWACARENKQMREGIQELLFGQFSDKGSGLIPRDALTNDKGEIQTWAMAGTANCVGTALIRHKTNGKFDGWSQVDFKTYAQGWQEFQGANRDLIWLDEEPDDPKVFTECLMRTRGPKGKEGSLYVTFTPLLGWTPMYLSFMPNGKYPPNGVHPTNPEKYVVVDTWKGQPHLSEAWKQAMIEQIKLTDPNSLKARTEGIAAMGSGMIYPVSEDLIVIKPFQIPEYWPRAFGLDFGWHATAAVWIAQDPVTKCKYVYSEYKHGDVADYVHIQNIRSKGNWIPGIADPSGGGRMDSGVMRIDSWRSQGLTLSPGVNALIPGIASILNQFESGLLKIFDTCTGLINERRAYRYDLNDPNKPAPKQDDHLLDALRYADSRFDSFAISESMYDDYNNPQPDYYNDNNQGRDLDTGY